MSSELMAQAQRLLESCQIVGAQPDLLFLRTVEFQKFLEAVIPILEREERNNQQIPIRDERTLRDEFAMQAIRAFADHKAVEQRGLSWLADHAYMLADAMLERRKAVEGRGR